MLGEAAWVAGDVHLANGDLAAAREAYDRAVHELPLSSALWVDVARFREANADTLGARDAVDYAIELDKTNSAALAFKARSEEHTSELQSLMRISYAVFCLKKKKKTENKPSQVQLTHRTTLKD